MRRPIDATSNPVGRPSIRPGVATTTNNIRQGRAAKAPTMPGSATKEALRSRVEKLERANAILRQKNLELRSAGLETAKQVDALTLQLAKSDRQGGRRTEQKASAEARGA
jgi:hypothetical protein